MLKVLLTTLLALSVSGHSVAQDNAGTPSEQSYYTTSFGVPDCGQWIKKSRPGSDVWLMGYLSGLNKMFNSLSVKPNPAYDPLSELSSADQAFAWMDNWCRENPLKGVDEGALMLHTTLLAQKIRRAVP